MPAVVFRKKVLPSANKPVLSRRWEDYPSNQSIHQTMPKNKVNFPAFPIMPYAGDRDNAPIKSNTGMSMRDFFASMSLIGMAGEVFDGAQAKEVAEHAYQLADAMLEELVK